MMSNIVNSEKSQFTAKQQRVIEWLATTRYDRVPPTQALLANELGIRPETITRWKRERPFLDAVNARARELVNSSLPEIYAALTREAQAGSFPHIKLILEMIGDYRETSNHDVRILIQYADSYLNNS